MTADCTILMLNSGRRVEMLRAFRAAFAAMRLAGRIVCTDINGLAPTLYLADAKYRLPRSAEAGFGDSLMDIGIREKVSLIVPFIDPDLPVLASLQPSLIQQGLRALISPPEAIAICRDKIRTHDFLKSYGYPTPDILSLEEARRHDFPMFVKPRAGSASVNAFKATTLKELEFFAEYVPEAIVQEFVSGQEYTVDVFSDWSGQPIAAISRRRLRVRAGEVLVGRIEHQATLEEQCKQIARDLGTVGPINVQAIVADGRFWITEINPRFGGGCPLSIAAGAPLCRWAVRLALHLDLPGEPWLLKEGLTMMRFDDSLLCAQEEMSL